MTTVRSQRAQVSGARVADVEAEAAKLKEQLDNARLRAAGLEAAAGGSEMEASSQELLELQEEHEDLLQLLGVQVWIERGLRASRGPSEPSSADGATERHLCGT